jgi:hypothetical protein
MLWIGGVVIGLVVLAHLIAYPQLWVWIFEGASRMSN